jgi:hypothetical protein
MDFVATINEIDVPEDTELTTTELHNLLAGHQAPATPGDQAWRLWLLVGSRMQEDFFGIMFDEIAPHRQGAAGFHDPELPDSSVIEAGARGQALGNVPLAFLRTLVHEAGHAFNLFHPKADVHNVAIGTTIMNQTGDVISFATAANPYPCTATLGFEDHNLTSLIHSPDPQVKPGWKEFGWGHGSLFGGVPAPTDVAGLRAAEVEPPGLRLELLYTSSGITFDQPGRYTLHAELNAGEVPGELVRSDAVHVVVRPATSEPELELERLATDRAVGLAFALGDYGAAPEAREKLETLMERFSKSDTGAASAMVIANSAARQLRDVRAATIARTTDDKLAKRALDVAVRGRDATTVARLAAAVVSPVEPNAPLIEEVRNRISARKGYRRDDSRQAKKILDDHLT